MPSKLLSRDINDLHSYLRWHSIARYLDFSLSTLDVGCNIGTMSLEIAQESRRPVTALDYDQRLLPLARERFINHGIKSARFSAADAACLPYKDQSFEQVVLADILEHVEDDAAVIRECFRVLKPGGRLVINAPRPNYARLFNKEWIREIGHLRDGYELKDLQRLTAGLFEIMEFDFNSRAAEAMDAFYNLGRRELTDELLEQLLIQESNPSREAYGVSVLLRRLEKPEKMANQPERVLHVGWGHPPSLAAGPVYYLHQLMLRQTADGLPAAAFTAGIRPADGQNPPYVDEHTFDGVQYFIVHNRPAHYFDWENPERETSNREIELLFEMVLKRFQPAVVHFHNLVGLSASLPAIARKQGLRVVFSAHNYWMICPRDDLFTPEEMVCSGPGNGKKCAACVGQPAKEQAFSHRVTRTREILSASVDRLLAVSERVREIYQDFGIDQKKITVQRIGSVAACENWKNIGRKAASRKNGQPLQIGFLGTLLPRKGAHIIVKAAHFLRKYEGKFTLSFYGGGMTPEYERHLIGLIGDDQFLKKTLQFRGAYSQENLSEILSGLDAAIIPPVWEDNGPQTVMEALGAGVPVIGSRIGGIPDFVYHGENGLLFEAGNAKDLAKQLRLILEQPELLEKLRRGIAPPLTMAEHARQLSEVYSRPGTGVEVQPDSRNQTDDYSRLEKMVQALLDTKKYAPAEYILDYMAGLFPEDLSLRRDQALLLKEMGRTDEARQLLEKLAGSGGADPETCNELAVLCLQQNQAGEAEKWFRRALKSDPDNPLVLNNMADFFAATGRTAEAFDILQKVEQLESRNPEVKIRLGQLCLENGKQEKAMEYFIAARELDEQNMELQQLISRLENVAGNLEEIRVSIIIPVFNQVAFTEKCLETLYRNTNPAVCFEVIVVDNASRDDTGKFLESATRRYPNLRTVRNTENLGFAQACNIGAEKACGEYLLFLNNDTEPQPEWLGELLATFEGDSTVGIAGSKLLYPDRTVQHAGVEFYYRTFGEQKLPWPYHDYRGVAENFDRVMESREVSAVTGACLMIPADLFAAVGGFDENYQMYFEDIDLNMKVRKAGRRIFYCHSSVVVHHEGKSSPDQKEIDRKNMASYEIFYRRWHAELKELLNRRKEVKHHVLWSAPFFNPSGYASEAIGFALGLDRRVDLQIYHDNPNWSREFIVNIPPYWRETLFRLHGENFKDHTIRVPEKMIFISHQPAHAFKRLEQAKYNIGRTMFETDRLPDLWVPRCNQMDEIWVPSQFNYETFARSGVLPEKIQIVPEGIDNSIFDPGTVESMHLQNRASFNFLSIFEWSERKGWEFLLRAYFEEFSADDDVCLYLRTYLMNHYDQNTETAIRKKIGQLVKRHGYRKERLPRVEILASQLTFQDMLRLYKSVDAFVLPSRGEGWGRPYMEAMCMELPVIATNWSGNTAFMTEENSFLVQVEDLEKVKKMEIPIYVGHKWARPSKNHLRKLMRQVMEEPELAKSKARRARQDIVQNFSLDAVARVVVNRLQEIEQELERPKAPAIKTRHPVKGGGPLNVLWEGDQFVHHSLAVVNRELLLHLVKSGINLQSVTLQQDSFRPPRKSPYRKVWETQNQRLADVDVHVRHHWPPNLTPPAEGHWVVIQPWEFGSLPRQWVDVFRRQVDEIWVPSNFVRQCYIDSGVPAERVFTIPNGINPGMFSPEGKTYPLKTRKKIKFLFVGASIFRKGIDILLEAYQKAFSAEDDVCLVIKDHGSNPFYQGQTGAEKIAKIQQQKNAAEIEYIDAVLSNQQLAALYRSCNLLVHPYRGEGFGMPILEAMACGLPVMVTAGGSSDDFCADGNAFFIRAEKKYLDEKRVGQRETIGMPWMLEPDADNLAEKMQRAAADPDTLAKMGREAAETAHRDWTWEQSARKVLQRMKQLKKQPVLREIKQVGATSRTLPIADALQAHRRGESAEALRILEKIPAGSAEFSEAAHLRGKIFHELGEYESALTAFREILAKKPGNPEAVLAVADIYLEMLQPQQAVDWLKSCLQEPAAVSAIWHKLFDVYQIFGSMDDLQNALSDYLTRKPDDADAQNRLGVLHWQQGQTEQALADFERAVAFDGKNPEHLKNLTDAYIQQNRFEEAISLLKLLMITFPHDFEPYQKMASLYAENQDFDFAANIVASYLEKNSKHPEAKFLLNLLKEPAVYQAYTDMQQGRTEQAEQVFREWLEKNPQSRPAQLGLARLLFSTGSREECERLCRRLAGYQEAREEALNILAQILRQNGEKDSFHKLLREFPKSLVLKKALLQSEIEGGNSKEVLQRIKPLQIKFPDDPELHLLAGMAEFYSGNRQAAGKHFLRVLQLDPGNPSAQENMQVLLHPENV